MIELVLIAALAQPGDTPEITVVESTNGSLTLDLSVGGSFYDDILGEDMSSKVFWTIGIGYELPVTDTGMLSFEFEFSQHNGDASGSFNAFGLSKGGSRININWNGDVQSNVFMFNTMWTQTLGSDNHYGLLVYGGLGIGYADNEGTLDGTATFPYQRPVSLHLEVSDGGFAWQVLGGIGWRFDAHSKVYLGGRYADLGTLNDALDIDLDSLVVELGYTYSF